MRTEEEKMQDGYGDETWEVFSALNHQDLQIEEEDGNLCLKISEEDFQFQLKKYSQIVGALLKDIRKPYEKNKELARRLHVNQTVLSAAASDHNDRKLKRDVILSALFSMAVVPTVAQADHKLMELMEPGLFTDTAFVEENRRNWVLAHILEHAQKQTCPLDNWLDYTNTVLRILEMRPLICSEAVCTLPSEDMDMLKQWRGEIEEIGYVDFSILRRKLLNSYRLLHGLDCHGGRTRAFEKLEAESKIGIKTVESVFGTMSNRNSNVNPETLIPVMAVMGCTLGQVNEMLRQANRELVYHASRSQYALKWIGRLISNPETLKVD